MGLLISIVAGFVSGVGMRSVFSFGWGADGVCFVARGTSWRYGFFEGAENIHSRRDFLLFVAFGMVRASVADTPLPEAFVGDLKHRVQYEGIVVGDPDVREKNQRIAIEVEKGARKLEHSQ